MLNKAHMTYICNAHMVPTTMHRTRRYVTLYILPILNVQINRIFFCSFFLLFIFFFLGGGGGGGGGGT